MSNEMVLRLAFFFGVFAVIAIWELVAPRRKLTTSKMSRWVCNLTITFLNPLAVRLLFPVLAVGMSLKAHESGWGLLNNFHVPYWLAMVIGILALDFVIYLQLFEMHQISPVRLQEFELASVFKLSYLIDNLDIIRIGLDDRTGFFEIIQT